MSKTKTRLGRGDHQAIRRARRAGLFVLVEGSGPDRVHVYFDARTGAELGRYYPASSRLLVRGRDGAVACAADEVPHKVRPNATGAG